MGKSNQKKHNVPKKKKTIFTRIIVCCLAFALVIGIAMMPFLN